MIAVNVGMIFQLLLVIDPQTFLSAFPFPQQFNPSRQKDRPDRLFWNPKKSWISRRRWLLQSQDSGVAHTKSSSYEFALQGSDSFPNRLTRRENTQPETAGKSRKLRDLNLLALKKDQKKVWYIIVGLQAYGMQSGETCFNIKVTYITILTMVPTLQSVPSRLPMTIYQAPAFLLQNNPLSAVKNFLVAIGVCSSHLDWAVLALYKLLVTIWISHHGSYSVWVFYGISWSDQRSRDRLSWQRPTGDAMSWKRCVFSPFLFQNVKKSLVGSWWCLYLLHPSIASSSAGYAAYLPRALYRNFLGRLWWTLSLCFGPIHLTCYLRLQCSQMLENGGREWNSK